MAVTTTLAGTLFEDSNVTIRGMKPSGAIVVGKLDGCIPEVTESFQSYPLALEAYARLISRRLTKATQDVQRHVAEAEREIRDYRQQLATARESEDAAVRKLQLIKNTGPVETRSLLVVVEDLEARLAAVERQLGVHEG